PASICCRSAGSPTAPRISTWRWTFGCKGRIALFAERRVPPPGEGDGGIGGRIGGGLVRRGIALRNGPHPVLPPAPTRPRPGGRDPTPRDLLSPSPFSNALYGPNSHRSSARTARWPTQ